MSPHPSDPGAPATRPIRQRAFDFEECLRPPLPDGRSGHAELVPGESDWMLAAVPPEPGFAAADAGA